MLSTQQELARDPQVPHRDVVRRSRTALVAGFVVALVVGLIGGYLARWTTEPSMTVTKTTTKWLSVPAVGVARTVTVVVDGLSGSAGSELAVIAYAGRPLLVDGTDPLAGLGSFTVRVDKDPFSVTETVRKGSLFSSDPEAAPQPVAQLPPGKHSLVVYVSSDLGPYSEWVPADPVERWCQATVTVAEDRNVVLHIRDVQPRQDRPVSVLPECAVIPSGS